MIGDTANSEVVGKHGEKVTVDVGIAEAKPEDYDALLIPGGFSQIIYVEYRRSIWHIC